MFSKVRNLFFKQRWNTDKSAFQQIKLINKYSDMAIKLRSLIKAFALLLLISQVAQAFTMPESMEKTASILKQHIVASKISTSGKVSAFLSKSSQVFVYNDNHDLLGKILTCEASNLQLTEKRFENQNTVGNQLEVKVYCNSGETQIFEYNPEVKKFTALTPSKAHDEGKIFQGRLLQNGTALCGNGVVESGEGCDDGNTLSGDGCSSTCVKEYCGDKIVNNNGEQCDDGNTVAGDGCSSSCKLECGDGIIQSGETCDDGNRVNGDGCSSTCQRESVTATVPLAVGIPLGVLALAGIGGAIYAIAGGSKATAGGVVGANYASQEPSRAIQIEESTKIIRPEHGPHI